jgi:hypothetical protein
MNTGQFADQLLLAAATLAGLVLVFLSNAHSGFEAFDAIERESVRTRYMIRGWLAFAAFASALLSCLLVLSYYWRAVDGTVAAAAALLAVALILALVAAVITASDIG